MEASPTPDVSILVVAYHSAPFIGQCIRGIAAAAQGTAHEILLIDNGGGDTEAVVRAEFPHVRIVPSEGNIGFGAGNNRCAAHARAPRLLLVNPDAIPRPGAIDLLVAFAKAHPDAAAWGGRSYFPNGQLDHANFLPLPTVRDFVVSIFSSSPMRRGGLPADATAPGPVEVLNGGFMMVDARVWREIDGFDEGFFLYSEEIDLFQRIRARGYSVLVDPAVGVVHDTGGGHSLSPTRVLFLTTGRMHYARKHFGRVGAVVTGWALWANAAKYVVIGGLLGRLSPRRAARWNALRDAWSIVFGQPRRWWHGWRDHVRT